MNEIIQGRKIDPEQPMVALTFDDGPSEYTDRILNVLERYDGRATFFVRGDFVVEHGHTVVRANKMGNEIGGHTWTHPDLTQLSEDEVRKEIGDTQAAIMSAIGHAPAIFRPPYGEVNGITKKVCREMDLAVINWSLDTWDWQTLNTDAIYNEVMDAIEDRDIVLFHDQYDTTAEAAENFIPELTAQGYQLVTVSELFHYSQKKLKAGQVYDDAY
jgi:peptidoglycan/xylan/chitin deacetylase (PgdA/CDA1 family)